jgi:hypothetical protein
VDNPSFTATGVEMHITKKLCSKKKSPQAKNLRAFLFTPWELLFWATARLPAFES